MVRIPSARAGIRAARAVFQEAQRAERDNKRSGGELTLPPLSRMRIIKSGEQDSR